MYLSNKTRYIPSLIVISIDEWTFDKCTQLEKTMKTNCCSTNEITIEERIHLRTKENKPNCCSSNEITNDERVYLSNKTRYIPSLIVISIDE